jgi:hypothetical protein
MKKERAKGFIAGVIVAVFLMSTVAAVANTVTRDIRVTFRGIRLVVDGTLFTPRDGAGNIVEPFIWEGTTYLPVRAVAEALGTEVNWDGDTSTVYLGARPSTPTTTPPPSTSTTLQVGVTARVSGTTLFTFTPPETGMYHFETTNNTGDPLLEITNAAGQQIARDDDGGEGLNSLIRVQLTAGQTYTVNARFFSTGTGAYDLNVTRLQTQSIPAGGGNVQVSGTTLLTFTPNATGRWSFETTNNTGDPLLEIFDANGTMIARDDDSGQGLNSLIRTQLTAGQTYLVNARFFSTGTGSYTLNVAPVQAASSDISAFVGTWACNDRNCRPHMWICDMLFTADGRFLDGDGDWGNFYVVGNEITFEFDFAGFGEFTLDYTLTADRLVLTAPGARIVLDRE